MAYLNGMMRLLAFPSRIGPAFFIPPILRRLQGKRKDAAENSRSYCKAQGIAASGRFRLGFLLHGGSDAVTFAVGASPSASGMLSASLGTFSRSRVAPQCWRLNDSCGVSRGRCRQCAAHRHPVDELYALGAGLDELRDRIAGQRVGVARQLIQTL
jgi:hypothetical protein